MSATPTATYGAPASPGTQTYVNPDEVRRLREERIHNARAAKAKTLALYLRSCGVDSGTAARMSDTGWTAAGDLAGVRMESGRGRRRTVSQPSRSAVVALLSLMEDLDELT